MSEGFEDPIVGGGGDLIRESIHSPDYAAGTTGWSINRDGTAEFNDLDVRTAIVTDDLHVQQDLFVDQNATVVGDFQAAAGVELGSATDTTQIDGPMTCLDDITLPNTGQRITRGAITAPTLLNSWTNFGGGFQNAGYIEYPDHTAGLIGTITGGTKTTGTVLFTLPAALRPAAHHVFLVPSTGTNYAQVAVQSGGNVVIQSPTAGATWLGLDACRWPISGF